MKRALPSPDVGQAPPDDFRDHRSRIGRHSLPYSEILHLIFFALLLTASLHAQEVESGDVAVRELPDLPKGATHGYHEIAFLVTNHSQVRPHEVRIDIPDATYGHGSLLGRLSRTVVVGPASSVRIALSQPPLPVAGSGVRVTVDGRVLPEGLSFYSGHPNPRTYYAPSPTGMAEEATLRVLVSQRVAVETLPETTDENRYQVAVSPPDTWSGDWLAYSGYDGVVLATGELLALDVTVRDALLRYAESGGALLAMGPGAEALELPPAVDESRLAVSYTGFGVAMAAPESLSAGQLARVARAWERSSAPWSMAANPRGVHQLLPVLDEISVPVRGIFLVIVAFAILIGPVNLFVLSRRGRRIWLLWTVPAAALAACLAIFLYTLADEGLLRAHRSASLTLLDERSHRAVTVAWTGYYSTLTPGGGLRFAAGVEVTPVISWPDGGGGTGFRTLDLTDGQHLASGWVVARLPAYFMVRRNALRRERLRLRHAADGGLEVTNGLGAEIVALHLAAADGRVWRAGPVAAGATQRLTGPHGDAEGRPSSLRDLYQTDLPSRLRRLTENPAAYLRPATYLAVLADDPFLEPGIDGLRQVRREALVYGFLEELP